MDVSIQGLKDYIKKNKEVLITVTNGVTDKQNNNNLETKMGRKTAVQIFQETNRLNLRCEDKTMP